MISTQKTSPRQRDSGTSAHNRNAAALPFDRERHCHNDLLSKQLQTLGGAVPGPAFKGAGKTAQIRKAKLVGDVG
ncbi:hypothetical protein GCM10023333_11790 [Ferrimonas pelagia]|uniref:Uncharacterized protein n=1 Tax=Ferrimonas pelagia TaxID=1177826 RepID=A0ABP9EJL6_9GAMM